MVHIKEQEDYQINAQMMHLYSLNNIVIIIRLQEGTIKIQQILMMDGLLLLVFL